MTRRGGGGEGASGATLQHEEREADRQSEHDMSKRGGGRAGRYAVSSN